MRNLTIIFLTISFFITGCDFFEKVNPFTTKADTLEYHQHQADSIRRAEILRSQQEAARRERERADSISKLQKAEAELKALNRYHLIVGAFKTPSYAKRFNEKMLAQGHDSRIIMSHNDFHLVTIKSLDDYNTAVNQWREIRQQGEHLVWLYIKDL